MKRISKLRFDSFVAYSRHPAASAISTEIAWYADTNENVLGTVVFDFTDEDYNVVILGRDIDGRFRCIDVESSMATISQAKHHLAVALAEYERTNQTVFPQTTVKSRPDLFAPVAALSELNPAFVTLISDRGYSPALGIMKEMAFHFPDPDGNFVQQFQTTGFDPRLWELYLFAFLTESGFSLDRTMTSPDFMAHKGPYSVCVEAVTVNPSVGGLVKPPSERDAFMRDYMPMKFGSPLVAKLKKEYWTLPHVKGLPLVFAIEDFHDVGSMTWTSTALSTYLYGYRHSWTRSADGTLVVIPEAIASHRVGTKEIPSGYFFQPGAEHISAVLFSNSGTIAKFNRLGYVAGFGSRRLHIIRSGTVFDHDPNAAEPRTFTDTVTAPGYSETWSEGVSIFHNPRALIPLRRDLFPEVAHNYLADGQIRSYQPDFHPLGSLTTVLRSD